MTEDEIEELARKICNNLGQDPDAMVSFCIPYQFKTPYGIVYSVDGVLSPLWKSHASYLMLAEELKRS